MEYGTDRETAAAPSSFTAHLQWSKSRAGGSVEDQLRGVL
jgi:hypothetical protein